MSSLTRQQGYLIVKDEDDNVVFEGDSILCCHCGLPFIPQLTKGSVVAYCSTCHAYTCGPTCVECVPTEMMLDIADSGRNPSKVASSVGGREITAGGIWLP